MPDVGDPPFVDLPVNVGIIKGPDGTITLYDSGWKQLAYIFDWNTSCCWKGLRDQMQAIGLDPEQVTRIVVGHAHWDHAGQLSEFPNAVLYIQKEELKQIDFFLDYPTEFNAGHIRAVNTIDPLTGAQVGPPQQACARSPVCGYPPQTIQEILGKFLDNKARIVDGRHEVAPGLVIHPAFRGHTYGSQLLQVNTARGQLVFGSDTYSSWTGIRDWLVANIQQTDTIQQFLAYEKCYVLRRGRIASTTVSRRTSRPRTAPPTRSRPTGGISPRQLLACGRAHPGPRRGDPRTGAPAGDRACPRPLLRIP